MGKTTAITYYCIFNNRLDQAEKGCVNLRQLFWLFQPVKESREERRRNNEDSQNLCHIIKQAYIYSPWNTQKRNTEGCIQSLSDEIIVKTSLILGNLWLSRYRRTIAQQFGQTYTEKIFILQYIIAKMCEVHDKAGILKNFKSTKFYFRELSLD